MARVAGQLSPGEAVGEGHTSFWNSHLLGEARHLGFDSHSSKQPWEVGTLTSLLWVRKLEHREVKSLAQGHTAGRWQKWDVT